MTDEKRLSQRKEVILRALVDEYIGAGKPVSSKQLSDQLAAYGDGYGAATVRNELAALEEEGFVYQQHISAGRAPTDLGYRYFVERLLGDSRLTLDEQRQIRHQFYQVQHQLDEWVRLTASVMAHFIKSAAIITPPLSTQARLKHFELLSLNEIVALLVLVLGDGTVRQERLLLDTPAIQEDLSALAQRFNARLRGASFETVGEADLLAESEPLTPNARLVLEALTRMLSQSDLLTPEAFYHDGIAELLQRDEFQGSDPKRTRKMVEALESNSVLSALAPQAMASDGVQVIIGSENLNDDLRDLSVVVARYGDARQLSGLLGIVGPTRMEYKKAIALVRYMTNLLDDLLSDMYGS